MASVTPDDDVEIGLTKEGYERPIPQNFAAGNYILFLWVYTV